MKKHIIFDLDGTLIDSAPSILAGFRHAFSALGIVPVRPITPDVVGPPLMQTLATLAGQDDVKLLQSLAEKFKAHYDAAAYQEAAVYAGVQQLLEALASTEANLYIATNKRDLPTQKIIKYLDWGSFFKGVFALDTYQPPKTSKPLMVAQILDDYQIKAEEAIYIGDRYEGGLAADYNHLTFVMVTWGYADNSTKLEAGWLNCNRVDELQTILSCQ